MNQLRALIALFAVACTGSPDSVTVYGGRGTASYDTAGGAPAFDEQGYSYGLALTWNLPTTRSALEDERWADLLEVTKALERDAHDANLHSGAATVTVETGSHETKPEPENSVTAQTKTVLGLVAAALAAALIPVVKKIGKNRKRIESLEKGKKP